MWCLKHLRQTRGCGVVRSTQNNKLPIPKPEEGAREGKCDVQDKMIPIALVTPISLNGVVLPHIAHKRLFEILKSIFIKSE